MVRGKVPVLGGLIKAKAPIVVPKAKGPGFLPRNTVRVMCKVIQGIVLESKLLYLLKEILSVF